MITRRRQGFTLVELLVVISIIGMLVALLFPAVQAAREAGRRADCLNNQKQLATAMLNFESARGRFPGWSQIVRQDRDTGAPIAVSWMVPLLPYVERSDLYDRWTNEEVPWADPNLEVGLAFMTCPSNPEAGSQGTSSTVYVVNSGVPDVDYFEGESLPHGVFFNNGILPNGDPVSSMRQNIWMSTDYLSSHDGASNTLMLSENLQATRWVPVGSDGSGGLVRRPPVEPDLCFTWTPTPAQGCSTSDNRPARINRCTKDVPPDLLTNPVNLFARPSSHHPGVVVAFFADGHGITLNDNVDWRVYKHIMTPDSYAAGGSMSDPELRNSVYDPGQLQ